MRVRLVVDCEGNNPEFDPGQPADEANPSTIRIPAGTEIEDRMAWLLCFPEYGGTIRRAIPIDDEAKRYVAHEDKKMGRLRGVREVLALSQEEAAVATEEGQAAREAAIAHS